MAQLEPFTVAPEDIAACAGCGEDVRGAAFKDVETSRIVCTECKDLYTAPAKPRLPAVTVRSEPMDVEPVYDSPVGYKPEELQPCGICAMLLRSEESMWDVGRRRILCKVCASTEYPDQVRLESGIVVTKKPVTTDAGEVKGNIEVIEARKRVDDMMTQQGAEVLQQLPPTVSAAPTVPDHQTIQRLGGPDVAAMMQTHPELRYIEPPVEILVLLYGNYTNLHFRCINSIIANTPPGTYSLRIGCNEVCEETMKWLETSVMTQVDDVRLFVARKNVNKYPLMQKMFADIQSKWVVWFDDDTYVLDGNWLQNLSMKVAKRRPQGYACFGKPLYVHVKEGNQEWMKQASWYEGMPFAEHPDAKMRDKGYKKVDFILGAWFAMEASVIRELGWPDKRLNHNGGDAALGEALRQHGYKLDWYHDGIRPDAEGRENRRGTHEEYPEAAPKP